MDELKTWMDAIEDWTRAGGEGPVPMTPLNEAAAFLQGGGELDECQTLALLDEIQMWRDRAATAGQWQCSVTAGGCGRWVSDANGADDDDPEICDQCWASIHQPELFTRRTGAEIFRSDLS